MLNNFLDVCFNDFFSPLNRNYYFISEKTIDENGKVNEKNYDSRVAMFKKLNYQQMDDTIKDLSKLLDTMKSIRGNKLKQEIKETEEKLKNLKEQN